MTTMESCVVLGVGVGVGHLDVDVVVVSPHKGGKIKAGTPVFHKQSLLPSSFEPQMEREPRILGLHPGHINNQQRSQNRWQGQQRQWIVVVGIFRTHQS